MRPRQRFYFPKVVIRFGVAALIAFVLQVVVVEAPLGLTEAARRTLLVASYVLLLGFVLLNLRRPGLAIIGLGLLLNFLAIVTNGGLMPISPQNLERSGLPKEEVSLGDWVPNSKDVLLARDDTNLWFLTDILVWKNPSGVNAFSVGDVIIGAGLVITLGELFLPRVQRVSRGRPSPT